jgi:hypothetical protein
MEENAMNDSGQNKGAEPMPPVYTKLKALYLTTELVKQGKPNVTLITSASGVYDEQAFRIQQIIETRAGFPDTADHRNALRRQSAHCDG